MTKYTTGLMDVETLTKTNSKQSKTTDSNKQVDIARIGLSKEIKVYTEEEHVRNGSEEIQELYEELKEIILSWDRGIQIKPIKLYNSFKLKRNIVDIRIQKNALKNLD